jgi:tellurite resistance protein
VAQSVRFLPVGLFGGVMGLEGLGLAFRDSPLPHLALVGEFFVWAGVAALLLLLAAYATKLARYPAAVRDEFLNPVQMGFCATLPVGLTLAGGGLLPYSEPLAQGVWWTGSALLLCYQVWALYRWITGGIELGQVNGGWMIIMIGGIVVPGTGVVLGNPQMSAFLFGLSAVATPFVMGLVFYRTVVGPPLPEPMRPTWFIFLVPPSLIYANGLALAPQAGGVFLNGSYYAALMLLPALLLAARGFLRWPFAATWWAFTFPLDALASAAGRYARLHPTPLWETIAALVLLVATFFVVVTAYKTLVASFRGRLLAAPA